MKVLLPIEDRATSEVTVRAVVDQFKPDTEVRVLHVVEWPRNLPMYLALGEGPSAGEDLLASRDRAFRDGKNFVEETARQLNAVGLRAVPEVRGGAAREAILASAEEWQPDLIVMGTHGRTGMDRLLLGSVSDAIVRRAHCSVEVVRGR